MNARAALGDGLYARSHQSQHHEGKSDGRKEDRGDEAVFRRKDGEGGKRRQQQTGCGQIGPGWPASFFETLLAEKRGCRNLTRLAKGNDGEGERGQEAEQGGETESAGVKGELFRYRQYAFQKPHGDEWRDGADHKADDDADGGNEGDLEEIGHGDHGGRCAQAFQRGDRGAFGIQKRADGICDADTADDEGGEAYQRQELREAVDVFGERGCRPVAGADGPASVRKGLVGRVVHRWP
ncbi:hypothetical protein D3C71_1246860 [compost metagenome]